MFIKGEREKLQELIELKLKDKMGGLTASITDEKFLSHLLDVCTLNQLRNMVEKE